MSVTQITQALVSGYIYLNAIGVVAWVVIALISKIFIGQVSWADVFIQPIYLSVWTLYKLARLAMTIIAVALMFVTGLVMLIINVSGNDMFTSANWSIRRFIFFDSETQQIRRQHAQEIQALMNANKDLRKELARSQQDVKAVAKYVEFMNPSRGEFKQFKGIVNSLLNDVDKRSTSILNKKYNNQQHVQEPVIEIAQDAVPHFNNLQHRAN